MAKDSEAVPGEGAEPARTEENDGMDTAEDECGMPGKGGCCDGVGSWVGGGIGPGSPLALEAKPPGDSDDRGRRSLEVGHRPASEDETLPGSGLEEAAAPSRVPDLLPRSCLISLKACWRIPDGADSERPRGTEGAGDQIDTSVITHTHTYSIILIAPLCCRIPLATKYALNIASAI